ncbi:MAG: hypothetical protein ACYDH6_00305 [Acidimicrobiales bacterium]
MKRRTVALGAACLVVAATGVFPRGSRARADGTAVGSNLGTFGMVATAPGVQITYDFPNASTHPMAEGEVPESIAQLSSGPIGYALATVAWPGPLAGNLGATAQILGLGLPTSVTGNLDDRVRAEARTGVEPSSVTNTSVPSTTMHASATGAVVEAEASTNGVQGPAAASNLGRIATHSSTALTGPSSAEAIATSSYANVDIAGVVKIASIIATATATTTAVTANAHGATTVSGVTIAGVPATITDRGLQIGSTGAPANGIANVVANQALAGAGIKAYVSQPIKQVNGAHVSYTSGSLVIFWQPPSDPNHDTFTITLGGASVTASAAPAFDVAGPRSGPTPSPSSAGGGQSVIAEPPVAAASPAPVIVPSSRLPGSIGPTVLDAQPTAAALPTTVSPVWFILAVIGAVLLGVGMRRVPDQAVRRTPTTCPLGGNP